MRVILELLRIIFIFIIVGGIFGFVIENVYLEIGTDTEKYGWIGYIAILLLFFVRYRNKLQFNGWYKGEGREKLPKVVSRFLLFISISLLFLPPALNFYFN